MPARTTTLRLKRRKKLRKVGYGVNEPAGSIRVGLNRDMIGRYVDKNESACLSTTLAATLTNL
jgi:hypothetical protein